MPNDANMPRRNALKTAVLLGSLAGTPATARAADELVLAPEPLRYCAVCHGVELMGNRAVDAPKLAGLPEWYLARQLEAFAKGWRGAHADDPAGMEMQPQAAMLSRQALEDAAAYAASVPAEPPPTTVAGNADRGAELYRSCAACHGNAGQGNQSLASPPLAGQNDWYLVTQLDNFRAGARGAAPGDVQGAQMLAATGVLSDARDVRDVVAYINTLNSSEGDEPMNKTVAAATLAAGIATAANADVTRHPLPNSDFPIAQAVEVSAGTTLVYHSGMTPRPAKPDAERYSVEFWGDTEAQAMSVFQRLEESLKAKGLGFGDVVKMQVFLVAPPDGDAMDFDGFMNAYRRFFGSEDQPNLPARSAFQVAGLAAPGMLVEVEVVLARP